MTDKTLAEGKIGSLGTYEVDFKGGMLVVTEAAAVDGVSESLSISVSGKAVMDGIAKKIGGPIPAEIALFLESALGLQ